MKVNEFLEKLNKTLDIPTSYLQGGFGCRLGKDWYNKDYAWNSSNKGILEKRSNTDPLTFGFDCVCLVKAVLFWDFKGDPSLEYGGSKYKKDQDITVEAFKKSCKDLRNFDNKSADPAEPGELLFIGDSHIGVYIGNGEVIEATPAWKCCVQKTLTQYRNTTNYEKRPVRAWETVGHTSYIDYSKTTWESAYKILNEKFLKLESENEKLRKDITNLTNENLILHSKIIKIKELCS